VGHVFEDGPQPDLASTTILAAVHDRGCVDRLVG